MVPDFFSELTGWRRFSVRDHGRILVSVNHPIPWATVDPGPAVCVADNGTSMGCVIVHRKDEPCPGADCSCGFYAYKKREHAVQHGQGQLLARVLLWGRLVEHKRGYRASRIKLAEIFVPKDYPESEALASRYQIPVTIDEGAHTWTLESLYGLSQLNQLLNQWPALQNFPTGQGLQQAQNSPSPYLQQLNNYQSIYNNAGALLGQTIQVRTPRIYSAPIPLPQYDPSTDTYTFGGTQITSAALHNITAPKPKTDPVTPKSDPTPVSGTSFKALMASIEKKRGDSMRGDE